MTLAMGQNTAVAERRYVKNQGVFDPNLLIRREYGQHSLGYWINRLI